MHNLKDLRNNLDLFKKKFNDRNLQFDVNEFSNLDKINRELISKKENLEQEKKIYQSQKTSKTLKNLKKSHMKLIN